MPLLLLPYATTTQALSATTAQVIHGSQPYLTFDNGVTKVTTTDDLLGIKLSNGARFTPATNTSTAANPIQLPEANQSFADVGMLVPTNTNSIALSSLIGAPYNYWGDDDGDGQGANGITATGDLTVSITDSNGQVVSRDTILNTCGTSVPPYKLVLTSTAGSLTTQYGLPNSSNFSGDTVTYYISPKAGPTVCYARPNLNYGKNNEAATAGREHDYFGNFLGPADIWNPEKGFLVQSTTPSDYNRNFPTTGANKLHFDLLVTGIDASTLTWPTVRQGGITATMTLNPPVDSKFNPDGASSVRVTLTGPFATAAQQSSATPGSIATPTLPQTFVLVGKDSSNREVLSYGFVIKKWFIHRGSVWENKSKMLNWCYNLGYVLVSDDDVTNAAYTSSAGWVLPDNSYHRNIGAGFLTEWGDVSAYAGSGYNNSWYWGGGQYTIASNTGSKFRQATRFEGYGICVLKR
ncbi:hypothetical protein A9G13_03910 [Gilliamella sp. wkB178]|uniref:hypothetical protein n=1 Tax=Gilliamella sp. wkB178 TaxID=3120259 RepID=UPI00080E60F1|nr:hypothetical protein [Gilliamella apicola]OCG09201.1 hypothetical protein A9G13_03910 [Gilliamella apicola]